MKSPGPWCFSPPTTAATLREPKCLWMAVLHKCRPFIVSLRGECLRSRYSPSSRENKSGKVFTNTQVPSVWQKKARGRFWEIKRWVRYSDLLNEYTCEVSQGRRNSRTICFTKSSHESSILNRYTQGSSTAQEMPETAESETHSERSMWNTI